MKTLHAFLISFIMLSCSQQNHYQQATSFSRSDFNMSQSLVGSQIEFDDLIMNPTQLYLCDTLLITCNTGSEKLFHIFNLKTKKKIGERITMGQGPQEMILPYFIPKKDSILLFDMMTSVISAYSTEEFIHNPEPVPAYQITLEEKPLWSELAILGDHYIGISGKPNVPGYLFDKSGKKIKEFGSYPISQIQYSDIERIDAYRSTLTSNQMDKVAISHFFTDLIEIYDSEGNLEKCLHGPDQFFPHFKEFHDGEILGSNAVPGTYKDAYYSPVSAGDNLYLLYNGKNIEDPNYNLLAQEIFVFGWDGTPKQILKLDQGVLRIAVDEQNNKIYGISNDPEFHIVEFSLQK